MFTKKEKNIILEIAKNAIKEAVLNSKIIKKDELIKEYPFLKEKGAVFVTINEHKSLRGCIGSIIAHRTLIDDIIANAKAAALNDPRFEPIRRDELENLEIEVSILTPPTLLEYSDINDLKSKVRVGVDGIIINYNGHQATYLPSVWEQISNFEEFFSSLCMKAGLSPNCLELHPTIYRYQAIKIKDGSWEHLAPFIE